MVEQVLKSFYPETVFSVLDTNNEYGFEIKHAELNAFKCQLIFTEGLANYKQDVKEGCEEFERIELYFCLPEYWKLDTEFWPIEWISKIAEVPQKYETWFGPGDTIPAGKPPQLLTDRFPANHFMLAEPIELKEILSHEIWKEKNIQFLGIIPISQVELDYKMRNSATVLLARLAYSKVNEKVDVFRKSVCRKRILGLF